MEVLCVGDLFLSSEEFRRAIEKELGEDFGPVREVMWAGERAEDQHHLQQIMEVDGPEAAPTPDEIVEAVGDAEVIAVHFAPIPKAVLEAGPNLKAVVVARAGTENVNIEAASEHEIAVVQLVGRNAPAVAEQAIALMLAETRDIARADRNIQRSVAKYSASSPAPWTPRACRTSRPGSRTTPPRAPARPCCRRAIRLRSLSRKRRRSRRAMSRFWRRW